ncbi:hypothetical protein FZEAL_3457 [Fusarium zealandicum]|uniref:PRISE-like Rossmann-fold domain-containing protein n=1 Tax=Fusarium zealandicum TaxID=1053134 RepID=A0A8H4UNP3_9HYPO|nr:hypothetical protein FZEAL_3457 [Fusarium zealandicum]
MSSKSYPLRQVGIYRNLPTFDPAVKNLTAIICGAGGISGFNTLRALLDSPERWASIYTLSRSGLSKEQLDLIPPELRSRIKHVPTNMSSSPEEIAKSLTDNGVSADYVFYYTYVQPKVDGKSGMDPSMAKDLVEANAPLFENFMQALEAAEIKPKRILLQTGGKNYGMHIGRVRTPVVESDPQPRHLQPNFYYPMEDAMKKFCERHPETSWNVIRPVGIIGVTHSSPLNMMYPFGVYAAVQAQKKEPLRFGGEFDSWQFECCHSTARLTGYLSEWAVLEDSCANEAFNAQDGGVLSWDRFFNELARWFDVEKGVIEPNGDEETPLSMAFTGSKDAPLGYGPPMKTQMSFTLADWFQDPTNREAWEEIMRKNPEVKANMFADGSGSDNIADFAYTRFGTLSTNKMRRFGFCGFVDTLESMFETFDEMHGFGLLPKMKVDAARPLV